jgi:hypothetical protein
LACQLHHPHLIRDGFSKHKSRRGRDALSRLSPKKPKKSQADKPTWPFWLKLSAGGQLDGYLEYVELVVVAAVSLCCEQAPKLNALAAMATIMIALKSFT